MIYVSSSGVKAERITSSIEMLYDKGFKNIELSGGTNFYDYGILIKDLKWLKNRYDLNFLLHNYFPPPKKNFVLNLASRDKEIANLSINHIKTSLDISSEIEAKYFGFHAGFFLDISLQEIGKPITSEPYHEVKESKKRFYDLYNEINVYAQKRGVEIFVENNVYSFSNFQKYGRSNPLMLLSKNDYKEMKRNVDFKLLLDYAHLKVSCSTLGLDFEGECNFLLGESKYIHLSDNNGLEDQNNPIDEDSDLYSLLKKQDLTNKIITLEVYNTLDQVESTYKLIEKLC